MWNCSLSDSRSCSACPVGTNNSLDTGGTACPDVGAASLAAHEDIRIIGPDADMIVIQALVVLSIMCALYFRFDSLIDHTSSQKRNNLRKLERVLFVIGLVSNIVAVRAQTPQFTVRSIRQSTPVSGAPNTLTVSLTANIDLATGSEVTIRGLTGSRTANSASLPVTSTSGMLGTSGAWTKSTGQLVLTVVSGGMASGTACVLTFTLLNANGFQNSPTVYVSATRKQNSISVG